MACDRDESAFAAVVPTLRDRCPFANNLVAPSIPVTPTSFRFLMVTLSWIKKQFGQNSLSELSLEHWEKWEEVGAMGMLTNLRVL